jgi:hypothetical protein
MAMKKNPDLSTPGDLQLASGGLSNLGKAYRVAQMVCQQGLSANAIARQLFPEEYREKSAQVTMRVKRYLQLAVRRKLLRLIPPEDGTLAAELAQRFQPVKFYVVANQRTEGLPEGEPAIIDVDEPVYLKAARILARRIDSLLAKKEGEILIGNAGGPVVMHTIRHLHVEAIAPRDQEARGRLQFLSLNAARTAKGSHLSANFLAVRMADIYGGRHLISLFDVAPQNPSNEGDRKAKEKQAERERDLKEYQRDVQNLDVAILGAGTRNGVLCSSYDIKDAVGDIALIPIDAQGEKVRLSSAMQESIEAEWMPRPSYEDLLRVRERRSAMILLVLARPAAREQKPGGRLSHPPLELKARIARAALRRPLVTHCVLGTDLAREILRLT